MEWSHRSRLLRECRPLARGDRSPYSAAMPIDPIAQFGRWFSQARRAKVPMPDAMALATATGDGRPSVRYVLLKNYDPRGFVFFTDARSRKGGEIASNRHAALPFFWDARE